MLEDDLVNYMIKNVDDRGHFCPVEAHTSQPGIPDFSYTIRGINGWLEIKAGTRMNPPNLRQTQWVWFRRNLNNGGNPLIFCGIDDGECRTFGLIHGSRYDDVYMKRSIRPWLNAMSLKWEGRIGNTGWQDFLRALAEPKQLLETMK